MWGSCGAQSGAERLRCGAAVGQLWGRTAQMWGSCGAEWLRCGADVAQMWGTTAQILRREGYTVQVNVNDYLDIYCPRYDGGSGPEAQAEQYALYMVDAEGYRTCNSSGGSKRWECRRPAAPRGPVKFSEKFQRYSAFSLGFEFRAGREYYYICGYSERGPINAVDSHSTALWKFPIATLPPCGGWGYCNCGLP
uniref:Ephrin RBD domain-containing protein n=1 Tax=Phasianus colchicus TaxID=9054 RepID=A0A669QK39_PHACC